LISISPSIAICLYLHYALDAENFLNRFIVILWGRSFLRGDLYDREPFEPGLFTVFSVKAIS
jgi:hypothetical protein